jgi:hypothetical protein
MEYATMGCLQSFRAFYHVMAFCFFKLRYHESAHKRIDGIFGY